MSGWQPTQYDPRQHQQRIGAPAHRPAPDSYPPPPPGAFQPVPHQPYGQYPQQQPRRRKRGPLLAVLVAIVLVAGGSAAYALTGGSSPAKALTCGQQYANWKTGPARAEGKQLRTDLTAMSSAGNSEDLKTMTSAIEAVGTDATALQQHPMPACADPAGYWAQSLADMKAAGDNAGTASGLGAILLAEAPLKNANTLEGKLTAELKRTTGS